MLVLTREKLKDGWKHHQKDTRKFHEERARKAIEKEDADENRLLNECLSNGLIATGVVKRSSWLK